MDKSTILFVFKQNLQVILYETSGKKRGKSGGDRIGMLEFFGLCPGERAAGKHFFHMDLPAGHAPFQVDKNMYGGQKRTRLSGKTEPSVKTGRSLPAVKMTLLLGEFPEVCQQPFIRPFHQRPTALVFD